MDCQLNPLHLLVITSRRVINALCIVMLLGSFALGQETPVASGAAKVYPLDTVASADGTLYIVDRNLPGVWKKSGAELSVFVQGAKRFREPLNAARCLAITADGNLIVGDSATRDVYRIGTDGKPAGITGGKIGIPIDLAVSADGTIYVADLETRTIVKIAAGTTEPVLFAKLNARGLTLDTAGNLWVVTQDNEQLVKVDPAGKSEVIVSTRVFDFPHQVVVNAAGEAWVTDGYGKTIWKVVAGQAPQRVVQGEPMINPVGISLSGDSILVTDPRAAKVFKVDPQGKLETIAEVK